jgi:hypothetical protein
MNDRPRQTATPKELLIFYAKLLGLLAGLAAFGFAVFWLRGAL